MRVWEAHELWHEYRHILFLLLFLGLCLYRLVKWRREQRSKATSIKTIESQIINVTERENLHSADQSIANKPIRLSSTDLEGPRKKSSIAARSGPKRVTGQKPISGNKKDDLRTLKLQPLVFYFSLTDSTKAYASESIRKLEKLSKNHDNILTPQIHDLANIDYEDYFEHLPKSGSVEAIRYFYVIIIPSYDIDTTLDNFLTLLEETHNDFRIGTFPLFDIAGYSVFGFGDREGWPTEAEGFCSQAVEVDRWMAKLTGRKRAFPLGTGDVKSNASKAFREWQQGLASSLIDISLHGGLGEGVVGSGEADESDVESENEETDKRPSKRTSTLAKKMRKSDMDDLEDLGFKARPQTESASPVSKTSAPIAVDFTSTNKKVANAPKAMVPVDSPTRAALTKQGYTIIGTHSGVKICRWTKSALRGRGSCYKYSFYGIKSHLCMETTPSLSCSNKCVFCWRHGTNPVGTTWRWQVDPPDMIFQGAKEGHYKKIKMLKGVPGVRAERFQEAMRIRHCALSLVGEPIFYPHINDFLSLLHAERISSFLVCNAQHPDQLAALKQVTQLYVSIDASNAESLRKIDRPLHRDYWQRFMRCLDILKERRFSMRTVFRLTLVKGFNIEEEVEGYADLVARGLPCFVEIKGVTYCGTSSSAGAGLTMQNVPFYTEVVAFVEALNTALEERGLEYGIAAEHAHSCCALIASKRFHLDGKWHTLIDYDRFFECLESGEPFGPEDYIGPPTPQWSLWGQGGFDPADERVYRKGKEPSKVVDVCGQTGS